MKSNYIEEIKVMKDIITKVNTLRDLISSGHSTNDPKIARIIVSIKASAACLKLFLYMDNPLKPSRFFLHTSPNAPFNYVIINGIEL